MNGFSARYATPLTIGLFLVATISGVALFFHWAPKFFHGMHEWLSMALLIPVGLHIQKNWFTMTSYFKKRTIWGPLLLSIAAAGVFVGLALNSPGRPPSAPAQLLGGASLASAAPLMGKTPESATTTLIAKGYQIGTAEETLSGIAQKSGKSVDQLFQDLAPPHED